MDSFHSDNNVTNNEVSIQELHKSDEAIRIALQASSHDIIVAHIDTQQRYTFIYNLHPGVNMEGSLGKRDDEIALTESNIKLRRLKRKVIQSGVAEHDIISFPLTSGTRTFKVSVAPLYDDSGNINGATSVSIDITDLPHTIEDSKYKNDILSLCTFCKSVRNDHGHWDKIEAYLFHNNQVQVSHGICPECMQSRYPDVYQKYNHLITEYTNNKDE